VRWVAGDAGLDLSDAALDAALIQGGGSARDTLSALELLASTGGDVADVIDLDEFLTALVEHDPGRVLTAMGHAVSMGRDPRTVTEDLVRHLRNAFLSLMAPELVMLPAEQLDRLAAQAQQIGAAVLVRAIERLGSSLSDMRHAPDPRILVEVALVQLTHDEAGDDIEALLNRIRRLEQQIKQLEQAGATARATATPTDPGTGRAVLGGAARRPTKEPASPAAAAPAGGAPGPAPAAVDSRPTEAEPAPAAPAPAAAVSVADAWEHTVKSQVKPLVRALYSAGTFIGHDGDTWQFGVPNEAHGAKCAEHRPAVEAALGEVVGRPITVEIVVGPRDHTGEIQRPSAAALAEIPETPAPAAPARQAAETADTTAAAASAQAEPDDEIDLSELTDAPPESVKTPIDRLAEAFPGSELVDDD
jgi:DNA polymerase-3 subunit gamma/tau